MKRILYISLLGVFVIGGCAFTQAENAEQVTLPVDEQDGNLPLQDEQPLPLTANDQTADANTSLQQPTEPAPALTDDNKETVIPEALSDLAMPVPQSTQAVENERQQPVDFNETFSKRNAAIAAKIEELKTRIASFVKGLSEKELRVYQKYVASSQGDDVAQWERNRKELYEVLTRENTKIFDALKEEYARLEAEQAELLSQIQAHTQRAAAKNDSN